MGMTTQVLRRIFLYIGLIIAATASLTGIILALFVCAVLRAYPCITLPDAYLVSYLPVSWQWYMPGMIFGLTLILSLIAVLIPLNRIEPSDTVKLLKFDS
jgi:lipoprotein-releasing system permease protein